MFASDYDRLLPEDPFERLQAATYEICEYVYGRLQNDADPSSLATIDAELAYHSHCQQRTLGLDAHTVAVLETCGATVHTTTTECCGMAGSFGYKQQYYDLSVDVGTQLVEEIQDALVDEPADDCDGEPDGELVDGIDEGLDDTARVVASGTSCADQLESLTDRSIPHPIELLPP